MVPEIGWSRIHLKCPSSKSGKLSPSQHHHLSVISVMVIKMQNTTQQAEREEREGILRPKSTLGENIMLPQPQKPDLRCRPPSSSRQPDPYTATSSAKLRSGKARLRSIRRAVLPPSICPQVLQWV